MYSISPVYILRVSGNFGMWRSSFRADVVQSATSLFRNVSIHRVYFIFLRKYIYMYVRTVLDTACMCIPQPCVTKGSHRRGDQNAVQVTYKRACLSYRQYNIEGECNAECLQTGFLYGGEKECSTQTGLKIHPSSLSTFLGPFTYSNFRSVGVTHRVVVRPGIYGTVC